MVHAAREVNPFFAGIAAKQCGKRESKRNGKARISGIKDWWMDHHLRILQQRIEAIAVAAHDPLHGPAWARPSPKFQMGWR